MMPTPAEIFELMRNTEMNDWVGGSDPEAVGDSHAYIVNRMLTINAQACVLDFGCGIGRGMVALLKTQPNPAKVVGLDIMPPVIQFCREHIQPNFANVSFEVIKDQNDHYDQFINSADGKTRDQITLEYGNSFSAAYAFSVFTHVSRQDYEDLLRFVGTMLEPGGEFLFTTFVLTEYSRQMIKDEQSIFPLSDSELQEDGQVLIGNVSDPLAFIAFDKGLIETMAWNAGLMISKIEYGVWMGGGLGASLQDLIVVRKPRALLAKDEIVPTPLVPRT